MGGEGRFLLEAPKFLLDDITSILKANKIESRSDAEQSDFIEIECSDAKGGVTLVVEQRGDCVDIILEPHCKSLFRPDKDSILLSERLRSLLFEHGANDDFPMSSESN